MLPWDCSLLITFSSVHRPVALNNAEKMSDVNYLIQSLTCLACKGRMYVYTYSVVGLYSTYDGRGSWTIRTELRVCGLEDDGGICAES